MVPEGVTARVSELAGAMRAAGARVGVGEVLTAHRALAAVDPADRDDAFYALRAAMCSTRAELDVFAEAFALVFMTPGDPLDDPLDELGQIRRAATPRASMPLRAGRRAPPRSSRPGPGRLQRRGAAAPQGLRRLHATPSAPPPGGC